MSPGTRPIRVLQVVRPVAGGIRQHVLSLVDGLDPARVTVSVAAPGPFVQEALSHLRLHAGISLDIAPNVSLVRDGQAARHLAHALPQFADVVHAHGVRAAWIAALSQRHSRGQSFPLVFTAHNLIENGLAARLALPLIARRCASILAVSPSVAESLVACGVPRPKIFVFPNGVDVESFSPGSLPARAEARQRLGLPEHAFVAAAAARLSPEKGIDIFLAAARQRPGIIAVIAGDGPLKESFVQDPLARSALSTVRFLGRLDDIRPLLAAADVFVMPSRREGQGIAVLEAMAAGVPVIASRVGGLADMLTDGETALLVPPADPDALSVALSRLQSDPRLRGRLAENAARLVQDRYRLQTRLEDITSRYEKLGLGTLRVEKTP